MKKIILTLFGTACILSCETDPLENEGCLPPDSTASVRFSVSDSYEMTKRSAIIEDAVNDCQIIVFSGENGSRLAYSREMNNGTVDLEIPKGKRVVSYALVNVPEDLSSVNTESELLDKRAYFKDNSVSCFEMIGHYKGLISADTLVCIPVERFVAKIRVEGVVYNLTCGYMDTETYTGCNPSFSAAYLLNSANDCGFDFSKEPTGYTRKYNSSQATIKQYEMTYCPTSYSNVYQIWEDGQWVDLNGFMDIYQKRKQGYTIWECDPVEMSVYCFPNHSKPYTNNNRSQIVFAFSGTYRDLSTNIICAHMHYFTFTLPELEHNTLYDLGKIQIQSENVWSPAEGSYDYPLSVNLTCDIDVIDMSNGNIKHTIPVKRTLYENETN